MTKQIKLYSKKALSVFMAALMLMTAWVFVAPEKAEAISSDNSGFSVSVGWASGSPTKDEQITKLDDPEANITVTNTSVSVSISVAATANKTGASIFGTTRRWSGTINIYVNGVSIGTIDASGSKIMYAGGDSTKDCSWSGTKTVNRSISNIIWTSGSKEADIPYTGSSTASFSAYGVDQFGKKIQGDITFSNNGGFTGTRTAGTSADSYTVTLPSTKRTAANSKAYTITASANNKSVTCTLTTYSHYAFYYDGNGGTISPSATKDQRYGVAIGEGNIPTSGKRTGFDFMGMYTSKNSDNYSYGNWTPTGVKLVKDKIVAGDTTYYAAWWAKNVNITFEDYRGDVIGTAVGKYDKTINDVVYNVNFTKENWAIDPGVGQNKYEKRPGETGTFNYVFDGWTVKSSKEFNSNNELVSTENINGEDGVNTTLKGDIVLRAVPKPQKASYSITFNNTSGGNIKTKSYKYNDDIDVPSALTTDTIPANDKDENKYEYSWRGWHEVASGETAAYYIVNTGTQNSENTGLPVSDGMDGYTDEGKFISTESGAMKVRRDATFVPVFEKKYKEYTVNFTDSAPTAHSQGTTTGYQVETNKVGDKKYRYDTEITVPSHKADYAEAGYRYTWNGWYNGSSKVTTDKITVKGDVSYTSKWSDGVAAKYKVRFFDYDGENVLWESEEVENNSTVTAPSVTETYREGDKQYDFDYWTTKDATPKTMTTSWTADGDADWYPVYTESQLYTINFYNYDGTLIDTKQQVASKAIGEDNFTAQIPEKAGDAFAESYTFEGWFVEQPDDGIIEIDSERVDGTYTQYTAESTMTEGALNLYAAYKCDATEYTVKFNCDGGYVSGDTDKTGSKEITGRFGDDISDKIPTDLTKDENYTYTYKFKSWDKAVSSTIKGDAEYTARWSSVYKYYKVKWVNDNDADIRNEQYKYGAKLNAPATGTLKPNNPVDNPDGVDENVYEAVFDKWVYDVAVNGHEKGSVFTRGDTMTLTDVNDTVVLKATYKWVAASRKVTFIANGAEFAVDTVDYGKLYKDLEVSAPAAVITDTQHSAFKGWKLQGTTDDKLIFNDKLEYLGDNGSTVTENTTFVAVFATEDHDFDTYVETTVEPTFWAAGTEKWECSVCGATIEKEVAKLSDKTAPVTALFVGNHGWRSVYDVVDFTTPNAVAPGNFVSITTGDAGDKTTKDYKDSDGNNVVYNASETGSGVNTMYYTIVRTAAEARAIEPGNDADENADWTICYQSEKPNELEADINGNSTGRLDQLNGYENLENGDEFIIVTKVIDKMGNVTIAPTGTLVLDNIAPKVELQSDHSNGASKFCLGITIVATDEGGIDRVDVDEKTLAPVDGAYTFSTVGIHQLAVYDIAGNVTRMNFEINGRHVGKLTTVQPSCTEDGYSRAVCTVCGAILENKTLPAPGHTVAVDENGDTIYRRTEATCTEAGTRSTYCSVCAAILSTETDPDAPAKNHGWKVTYEKAATCVEEGYQVRECANCGLIETIKTDIDPDAHRFYRAKTTAPTCVEAGTITQECKLCHAVVTIAQGSDETADNYDETLKITDHVTPGEVVITKTATCTEEGKQVTYCKFHGPDSEDPAIIKEEVIPATGHKWVIKETVAPTETEQGYTVYECANGCGETYKGDFVEPDVTYNITFKVEGQSDVTVANLRKGETITSADIAAAAEAAGIEGAYPAKAADEDSTYTFESWTTVNEDGETVNVSLPIVVGDNDVTYIAAFKATARNYTITFMKEDADNAGSFVTYKKKGYNKNGETVDISGYTVAKASDKTYDYEFKGWSETQNDAAENALESFKINGADVNLYPVFKATKRQYNVVWVVDIVSDPLDSAKVEADNGAEYTKAEPEKKFDAFQHYTFSGWKADGDAALNASTGELTEVYSDVIVYAQFTKSAHNAVRDAAKSTAATCTENGKDVFVCECGYTYEKTLPKSGHSHGDEDPIVVDGKRGWWCVNGCDTFIEDTTTYTVKFFNADGSKVESTIAYIKYNADISDKVPTLDDYEADGYKYAFKGWATTKNASETEDVATIVTADAEYYAVFAKTPLKYTVIYALDADNPLYFVTVEKGGSCTYQGEEPTKEGGNASGHYVFDGWSNDTTDGLVSNVSGDTYLYAKFKTVAHSFETRETAPTCGEAGKITYTCSVCGYSYSVKGKPATNQHTWVLQKVENSTEYYKCSVCGKEKTEQVVDTTIVVVITVTNDAGQPVENAKVTLYDGSTYINSGVTGSDGVVRLTVPEAKDYTIVIESSNGSFANQTGTIKVNPDGSNSISGVKIPVYHCSCACHKDGLWGSIFRFFHKIIKWITGSFHCCDDPDPRYN